MKTIASALLSICLAGAAVVPAPARQAMGK